MNKPKYKIHGTERRFLKKELSLLKLRIKSFWYYHNEEKLSYEFYGVTPPDYVVDDNKAKISYDRMVNAANNLEKQLKEPYMPNDFIQELEAQRLIKEKISLKEDEYYFEGGLIVYTKQYHLRRGRCCNNLETCKHCPFGDTSEGEE